MYSRAVIGLFLGLVLLLALWLTPASRSPAPAEPAAMPVEVPYLPPKGYVCYRAAGPVEIDGRLDEPSWQAVPWTNDFVDIEGDRRSHGPVGR